MTQTTTPASTPALATALLRAYEERIPLSPTDWPAAATSADDAYAVQEAVDQARHRGAQPRHWKSGGASRDVVLTHAPLPARGVAASPADLSELHFFQPGVEAEVALRLGLDVTPAQAAALDHAQAAALIDAIAVTIEIVDSRWQAGAPALLKLADTQSHGALVVGDWQPWPPFAAHDWSAQRCEARIGNQEPVVRTGTHPLGHPAWLLPAWLRHATRHGRTVPAGTVVTTGSWVGVLPVARGEPVVVRFDGIGEARAVL